MEGHRIGVKESPVIIYRLCDFLSLGTQGLVLNFSISDWGTYYF
jgi:hypothetical protein